MSDSEILMIGVGTIVVIWVVAEVLLRLCKKGR
jgi:hypothetical protein